MNRFEKTKEIGFVILAMLAAAPNAHSQSTSTAYSYDALGRLIEVVHGGDTISYAYDAAGNQTAVNAAENLPPIAVDDHYTVNRGGVSFHEVLANDYDQDGHGVFLEDEDSQFASILISKIRFVAPNIRGSYIVNYVVRDAHNATANGVATFTVPNAPPVTVNESHNQPRDITMDYDVLANDTDPDGDSLTIVNISPGASIVNNKGSVLKPYANFVFLI